MSDAVADKPEHPPRAASAAGAAVSTAAGAPTLGAMWHALVELGKLRLTALVVVTTGAGYILGAADSPPYASFPPLLFVLLGTALVSAGASAFNQCWEMDADARMARTRARPLPARAVPFWFGLAAAVLFSASGLSLLCAGANPLAAGLALASLLLYLLVYTPLKRRATLNTLAGAIPGAIPPLIGWAAATGGLERGAWLLFTMLYAWQIPHFLAIAWIYREDYRRAGFQMLPVVDPSGELTGRFAMLYALALVALSLLAPLASLGGWVAMAGCAALGAYLLRAVQRFRREPSDGNARKLFFASIVYLPAVLALLIFDPTAQPFQRPW